MSDEAPRSERHVDRRHFFVGGASVVAAGVLAPAAMADDGGEPETRLIEATVVDKDSGGALEAEPVAVPDADDHRFRVDLAPGANGARKFPVGATVAIMVAPGAGTIDVEDLGEDSEVTARNVVALVRGKRSDVRR